MNYPRQVNPDITLNSHPSRHTKDEIYHHLDLALSRVKEALTDAYCYFLSRSGDPYRLPDALGGLEFLVESMQRAYYTARLTPAQYSQLGKFVGDGTYLARQSNYCLHLLDCDHSLGVVRAIEQLTISLRSYAFGLDKFISEIQQGNDEKGVQYAR